MCVGTEAAEDIVLHSTSRQIERVIDYFRLVDAGKFPTELFARNFQFYFPKYGVGQGAAEFMDMAQRVGTSLIRSSVHNTEDFVFIEQGNRVAAEGTTRGTGRDGVEWHGGRTSGGRFCSIFVFDPDGLIERMHIYLDPDFTGRNREDFLAPERAPQRW
jgi:hypothetical protein